MATWDITAPDGSTWEITAPDTATEAEVIAYAQQQAAAAPRAPRAAQADVRRAEPAPATPSQADVRRAEPGRAAQIDAERAAILAGQGQIVERRMQRPAVGTGPLSFGKGFSQYTPEEEAQLKTSGQRYEDLARERVRETGEIQYEESLAYDVSKLAAAFAGFAAAGPLGATGAEGVVRHAFITKELNRAIADGALTEEQAADIATSELIKGMGTDAAFNVGVPALMKLLGKVPALRRLGGLIAEKVSAAAGKLGFKPGTALDTPDEQLARMFDPKAGKPAAGTETLEARVVLTEDPARQRAARQLAERAGKDFVPTPGQVAGEAGRIESGVRKASPIPFQRQEKALLGAAEEMRRGVVAPAEQPSATALGERVVELAETTQAAVKTRLRPTFQEAAKADVKVDLTQVVNAAEDAIERNGKVPGKYLKAGELAKLEQIVRDLRVPATPAGAPTASAVLGPGGAPVSMIPGAPAVPASVKTIDAEAALDFASARKADSRAMTADGVPSTWFKEIMGDMIKGADEAYRVAAAGKGDLSARLVGARAEYREMMETVYDDAVKAALRANPEDIGRKFWSGGNVSELEQLQTLLNMSKREGTMTAVQALEVTRNMTRGFLQEAVKDVQSAATWSQTLASDPLRRRTWETLTAGQGGGAMQDAMKVLEHAAQIASANTVTLAGGNIIPLSRAMGGGMGQSYVTGTVNPGMFLAGLNLIGLTKALGTMYAKGNQGAIHTLTSILRASSLKTPAAAKALQAALPRLEKWAAENDMPELFVGE